MGWMAAAVLWAAVWCLPAIAQVGGDPDNDPRVKEVARQLTCYCGCNTQSIAECTCGVAQKERREILASLEGGASADDVVAAWVERHGPQILLEPPRRGFNLIGWFLPSAVLLAASLGLILVMRRWKRRPLAAAPGADAAPPTDPRYLEQLERELEQMNP
jgi:cytochrome c-type biogenesis protein CcmH